MAQCWRSTRWEPSSPRSPSTRPYQSQIQTGTRAVALNAYTKEVTVQGPGGRDALHYDKLCVAVGSDLLALTLLRAPGEIGADIEYLKPMPDCEQIAERLNLTGELVGSRRSPSGSRIVFAIV